jgi:outer membrane protein OmpA-like peptidoglycan-associated protein
VIVEHGTDGTLIVVSDQTSVVVTLDDAVKVRRLDGIRSTKMTLANLIPGLRVRVDGDYDTDSQRMSAHRITFSRDDLKTAQAVYGGLYLTERRSIENQQRIEQHAQALQSHGRALEQGARALEAQGAQIVATEQRMVATTGALATRIGNLDDYNVIESVTIYFANGKWSIAPKYKAQLHEFAARAKGVQGAVVQVQAYASAVGSDALNQQLTVKRADAVTAVLQQSGVTPTDIAVPAAMGTTGQVASNKTRKGQAENRRAVITLLQNKGIAGK